MTDPVTYRRANREDVLTVCELGQALNAIHHEAFPNIFAEATGDFARDAPHWLPSLHEENRAAFLAERNLTAVGFITVQLVPQASPLLRPLIVGRIGSVCVAKGMRGRGIGRSLLSLAETWARDNGASDMRLSAWAFNERAIGLYRELGYETRAVDMGRRLTR